uniref:Putative terminase n=1 Tax=viral metagenome TaxID=1070528 RepID=A0A6M3IJG7_9ZZZZ
MNAQSTLDGLESLSDREFRETCKIAIQEEPINLVEGEFLSIKTKDGRLIGLKLNSTQRKLLDRIKERREAHLPIRMWLLKYRQGGISTECEALIYSRTSQKPNRNALIMADEKDKSEYLFQMSKLYQEELERHSPHLPPKLKKSNSKSLEFEDMHSQIIIETAENIDAARAFTYQDVHLSECAYFKNLRAVLDALNQSVPDHWDTMILGETTANGMNDFYIEWCRAIEGKTDWIPLFFAWFEMVEYSLPLQNDKFYPLDGVNFSAETSLATFEKEEQELKATFNLSDEQLNWRRWCIVNKCQGSLFTFMREYPATWQEAFATSGAMFFDQRGLAKQIKKRPVAIGELFFQNLQWEFRDLPHGRIEIFEKPDTSEQYLIAGDASEGIDADESAILVLNKRLNTTAAIVVGQHAPEELAALEIALGNFYNIAMIAQENKGYGYQVNQLVNAKYGNVYHKIINKDGIDTPTDELGFNTNSVTRPQMLAMLAEEIKVNSTSLYSEKLILECQTFVIKRDKDGNVTKIEAQDGVQDGKKLYQDGLVICRAIASLVRNQYPYKAVLSGNSLHDKQRAFISGHKSYSGYQS